MPRSPLLKNVQLLINAYVFFKFLRFLRSRVSQAGARPRTKAIADAVADGACRHSPRTLCPARLNAAVKQLMDRHVAIGSVGGASCAIFQHGKKLCSHVVGDVKEDTIFRMASMTKMATAICALSLLEDGLLYMNEDLTKKWLPELKSMTVTNMDLKEEPMKKPITMLALLSHTSGLGYQHTEVEEDDELKDVIKVVTDKYKAEGVWDGMPMEEDQTTGAVLLERLGKCSLAFQPGSRYLYSLGYDIAGIAMERITGKSLEDLMRERVFKRCGMTETTFSLPAEKRHRLAPAYKVKKDDSLEQMTGDQTWKPWSRVGRIHSGGGGLTGTVADFSRLCQCVVSSIRGDEPPSGCQRLLAPHTAQLMALNVLPPGMPASDMRPGLGQAIGCFIHADAGLMSEPLPKGSLYIMGFFGTRGIMDTEHNIVAVLGTQRFPAQVGDLRHTWPAAIYQALI